MYTKNHSHSSIPTTLTTSSVPRKGKALIVGLTEVNAQAYGGWDGKDGAQGCKNDVDNMLRIFSSINRASDIHHLLDLKPMMNKGATTDKILPYLHKTAAELQPGDLFVFYFTGHGVQYSDPEREGRDGDRDFDDAICCYDRPLIDLELRKIWKLFKPGVRIVMISDSCHSGTNHAILTKISNNIATKITSEVSISSSPDLSNIPKLDDTEAMLIHYGACRDDQNADGGLSGSPFTSAIYNILSNNFKGNYADLYQAILRDLQQFAQEPQYSKYGKRKETQAFKHFEEQRPFTVDFPFNPLNNVTFMYDARKKQPNDREPRANAKPLNIKSKL